MKKLMFILVLLLPLMGCEDNPVKPEPCEEYITIEFIPTGEQWEVCTN